MDREGANGLLARLPGSDCGACGGTDCATFAAALLSDESAPAMCPYLTAVARTKVEAIISRRATATAKPDLADQHAFSRFFRRHERGLLQFLICKRAPVEEAQDLCIDAFLILWIKREAIRDPNAFLFGTAHRLLKAHHRQSQRLRTVSLEHLQAEPAQSTAPDSEDTTDKPEPTDSVAAREVPRLLSLLTHRQRQVIEMIWLKGYTYKSTAQELGISEGGVRRHQHEAFARLRKGLQTSE